MNVKEKLQANEEQILELQKNSVELVFAALREMMLEKRIKNYSWKGYTPFFNDGEACIYEVCGEEVLFEDQEEPLDSGDIKYGNRVSSSVTEERKEEMIKAFDFFEDLLKEIAPFLEPLYEDHKSFVLTQEGLEIEEYDDHE